MIAVEIHQKDLASSDIGFDLEIAKRSDTGPKPVVGSEIAPATFVEKFKSFGIPTLLQVAFWNRRAEQLANGGDFAEAALALAESDALGAGDETDPGRLRIRALIATGDGNAAEADRLYTAAMDGMLQQAADGESIELGPLPPVLREAALVLRREPADIGFLLRRLTWQNPSDIEIELLLRWIRAKVGDDPDGLAQVWSGLTADLKRDQEALTIAEAVLASLAKPAAGTPVEEIRAYVAWLGRKEKGIRKLGDAAAADAILAEIETAPPRATTLGSKRIDLSKDFNTSLFSGATESGVFDLSSLPGAFVPLHGVEFDLRGIIQLESGTLPDGKTFNGKKATDFPLEHRGLQIGQATPTVHFLTSAQWALETRGVEIARFVIHYEDGSSETLPVKSIEDAGNWHTPSNDLIDAGRVAWRGVTWNGAIGELSELVWKNPHPEKTITTIDFISAGVQAAPFLVAITLE